MMQLKKSLYIDNKKYSYKFDKNSLKLTDAKDSSRLFQLDYLKINKIFSFNFSKFEMVLLLIATAISIHLWGWITLVLGLYLFSRWVLNKHIVLVASGNIHIKFDTALEKDDFMQEICSYDESLCKRFKKRKKINKILSMGI